MLVTVENGRRPAYAAIQIIRSPAAACASSSTTTPTAYLARTVCCFRSAESARREVGSSSESCGTRRSGNHRTLPGDHLRARVRSDHAGELSGTQGILNGLNVGDAFFNVIGAAVAVRMSCDSGASAACTITIGTTAGLDPESFARSKRLRTARRARAAVHAGVTAEQTDVPAQDIRTLVREYAANQPSAIRIAWCH